TALLLKIVYLAIQDKGYVGSPAKHGLAAGFAQIDNSEASVPQRRSQAAAGIRGIHLHIPVIGAPVGQAVGHPLNGGLQIQQSLEIYYTADSAHLLPFNHKATLPFISVDPGRKNRDKGKEI